MMNCLCWCHDSDLGYADYGCGDCKFPCPHEVNETIARGNRIK